MKTIKILTFLFVLSLVACEKEKDDPAQTDNSNFVEVIEAGGVPETVEEKMLVKDSMVTTEEDDSSTWICTTKKVSRTKANDEFPLFNPNASVIYPGSLLQGKTLSAASPSIIPVKRAGGKISIDITDGNPQPAFTVDEVTKSKIAEAANSIIGGSTGVVPANFDLTYKEIQSKEQLAIELGLNLETQFVELESKFSFRKEKEYQSFLVKLNQSFYTLSFDIPTSLKDIFAPEVTPGELAKYIAPGNPATFISDVTYGRIYYLLIESSASSSEMATTLNLSFNTATAGGGVTLNASRLSTLKDLQIKVIALGGESQSTFSLIKTFDGIASLAETLGASTDIRTGVPISYVVRSVTDKQVVSVKLATEYDIKDCVALSTPLGSPIVWWDASVLLEDGDPNKPINSGGDLPARSECIAMDGSYYGAAGFDAHFVYYKTLKQFAVIKKWPDISGNKTHASAIIGDPHSRPMLIKGAFNNGMPAVEFFRGQMPSEYINNRLSYSGPVFNNKDYTIFAVLSYPDRTTINVVTGNDSWEEYKTNVDNNYGYFMRNDVIPTTPLNTLKIGINEFNKFSFSHGKTPLEIDKWKLYPFQEFTVYAFRFSRTEGMAIFRNGVKVTEGITSPGETSAIQTNPTAVISAPYNPDKVGYARIRIGEIKAYGKAATDAQILRETTLLNQRYGL